MKVIFAQGNPGTKFAHTRHNVGFIAVDTFAETHGVSFAAKPKFNADIAEVTVGAEKVLLVKPTTFYNETGVSLRAIMDFYKVPNEDIVVIHDELALPFGTIRVRHSGRDAGNNGIKSLNSHIGESFARIRVGVQNDLRPQMGDTNFVVGAFSTTERSHLSKHIIPEVVAMINRFITGTLVDESVTIEP